MNKPPERFELKPEDIYSELWLRLSKHLEQRIASLRAQNDGDLDERKTAELRGRIAEAKALQSLGREIPNMK